MSDARPNRVPAETFPPGEYLRDILEQRGWTQAEFAEIIGRPTQVVNEIISGKKAITPETAKAFSAALDTSAEYWMNLETSYQLSRTSPAAEKIARNAEIRKRFPVREMMKRGWIVNTKDHDLIADGLHRYFAIKTVYDQIGFGHAARRSNEDESVSTIQWAWLYRVRQLAAALRVPKYSEQRLRDAIPELERLMSEPEEVRHVPRILSECGVRLVVVEPIPGSEIGGVCFWLDEGKSPVIGLSLKGDQIDKFWFNLWHEIEHVIQGDGKDTNEVLIDDFEPNANESECERIANSEAANRCVPAGSMQDFINRHNPMFSEKNFIGFSKLMKRHPGIVAGQIQKKIDRWDLFKKYQVRVRHLVVETALTDGYGRKAPADL